MEEVRSYWQVTSISHFCNIFGKPFKLPQFEPEELEQAFILDIPAAATTTNNTSSSNNKNTLNSSNNIDTIPEDPESPAPEDPDDSDYQPAAHSIAPQPQPPPTLAPQGEDHQELHLLVKLAIALLKPHFNCKISHSNWENYLRRIVDSNWVELERHPSPFRVPLISQDGVELTKNLTFNELPLSDKIDLFYALCDYRLWCEDVADALKDYTLEELRLESIGKDSQGYEYWYFSGTRLFRENKTLSQDIVFRKTRIKELQYSLIELEKTRISREQEEKRKAELQKAKQAANEAREARIAAKKQQDQESSKKKKPSTHILPPRTGLRERRSSATSNNNVSQQSRTPTTRSKQQSKQQSEQRDQQSAPKTTRSLAKNSKNDPSFQEPASPDAPKKSPEEECKDELEQLAITPEDRAEAWSLHCEALEDWENFAVKFEKTKSTNEKYLSAYVNDELLPKIRAVYAKRAAEVRKKEKELLFSLSSRRVSTRIISKRAQEEEEERQAQIHEAEMRRKKVEAETRLRAELEREMRARQNRFVVNGEASSTCSEDGEDHNGRYNLRQQQNHHNQQYPDSDEFDGIIHPDKLSEFYEALELVIDTVRTSKHAWPFVEPVPDNVPGYYDLIKEPMDLRKLRTKIEFREYKSLIELEKDFQLLVNNCEKFNGPRNIYTKMVYKLWKSFRKNVRLYLSRDLSMDEYETFVYPPPPKPEPKAPTPEPIINDTPPVKKIKMEHPCEETTMKHNGFHKDDSAVESQRPVSNIKGIESNGNHKLTLNQNNEVSNWKWAISPPNYVSTKPLILSRATSIPTAPSQPSPQQAQPATPQVSPLTPPPPQPKDQELPQQEPPPQEQLKSQTQTIIVEYPADPIGEEIIIDSYDVPCPDDNFFLWPQDNRPT